jgi:hypothetical protein
MNRVFTRSVACATVLFLTGISMAQTGPTGPAVQPNNPGTTAPAATNQLTPQEAMLILQRQGHTAELVKHNNNASTVKATVTKDNWRFVFEITFSPNGKNVDFLIPLGNPNSQFSSAQLLELFKKSYEIGPMIHFSYRGQDQRLCLEDPSYTTGGMNEQLFTDIVNKLMKIARDTHSTWDTSRWPMNGVASTVPSAQPTLPGTPATKTSFNK